MAEAKKDTSLDEWFQSFEEKHLGENNSTLFYKRRLNQCIDSVVDDFQSHYHLLNAQQQAFLSLHPDLAHVGLRLSPRSKDTELWFRLCPLTNEMIVTKQGRNVYPKVVLELKNMVKTAKYHVFIEVIPVDHNKYTYNFKVSKWEVTTKERYYSQSARRHFHPESPMTGEKWMQKDVEFTKLKLSNKLDANDYAILESMQKYQLKACVALADSTSYSEKVSLIKSFVLPETQFVTLSSYINQSVSQLNIDNNKYASGFRGKKQQDWEEYQQEEFKKWTVLNMTDQPQMKNGACCQQQTAERHSQVNEYSHLQRYEDTAPNVVPSRFGPQVSLPREGAHYLPPTQSAIEPSYYNGYSVYQQPPQVAHLLSGRSQWAMAHGQHPTIQYNISQPNNIVNSVTYYSL